MAHTAKREDKLCRGLVWGGRETLPAHDPEAAGNCLEVISGTDRNCVVARCPNHQRDHEARPTLDPERPRPAESGFNGEEVGSFRFYGGNMFAGDSDVVQLVQPWRGVGCTAAAPCHRHDWFATESRIVIAEEPRWRPR